MVIISTCLLERASILTPGQVGGRQSSRQGRWEGLNPPARAGGRASILPPGQQVGGRVPVVGTTPRGPSPSHLHKEPPALHDLGGNVSTRDDSGRGGSSKLLEVVYRSINFLWAGLLDFLVSGSETKPVDSPR